MARFVIGVLALLVVTSTAWYLLLDYLLSFFLWLTEVISSQWLLAEQVISISNDNQYWAVLTTLSPLDNPIAFLPITVDPTRYTIGLPFFWALVVAVPETPRFRNLAIGTVLLTGLIVGMIMIEILFNLLLVVGPKPIITDAAYVLAIPFSIRQAYAIGLCHQLALVATTVLPIIIWAFLNTRFIRKVSGNAVP